MFYLSPFFFFIFYTTLCDSAGHNYFHYNDDLNHHYNAKLCSLSHSSVLVFCFDFHKEIYVVGITLFSCHFFCHFPIRLPIVFY